MNSLNLFYRLTFKLEFFTALIPIPSYVYFIAVVGEFKTIDQIYSVATTGLIAGFYTITWGIVHRYIKIKSLEKELDKLKSSSLSELETIELKKKILFFPYSEGRNIAIRWIIGATSGILFYRLLTSTWGHTNGYISLYVGLLFSLPISYVFYVSIVENEMRPILLLPKLQSCNIPKEQLFHIRYFLRMLLSIFSVAITPVVIFGFILYSVVYGKISFKEPVLHITLLSLQCFLSMIFISYVVAMSVKRGLSITNQHLMELGSGNFSVNSNRTSLDDFGEQANLLGVIIEKLRSMYLEIKELNQNLEEKVEVRTKELANSLTHIKKLKEQQDGDYYLTSLIIQPLVLNSNQSKIVKTDFIIKQKKKFEFMRKKAELGGDICITGNLKFHIHGKETLFVLAMNADAMGKSMQGAGGAIVIGVIMNSILARFSQKVISKSPEDWLKDTYYEIGSLFKAFGGTMLASAILLLINEETGQMYYWNAEHPFIVLYRDQKASFIESEADLHKLGFDFGTEFVANRFQLLSGDQILIGSDGKDDLLIRDHLGGKEIVSNPNQFLEIVEKSFGDIHKVEQILQSEYGELTDDLSLLSIVYNRLSLLNDGIV